MTYIDILAEYITSSYNKYKSFSIWRMFWHNREFCIARDDLEIALLLGKQSLQYCIPSWKTIQLSYVIGRIEGDITYKNNIYV